MKNLWSVVSTVQNIPAARWEKILAVQVQEENLQSTIWRKLRISGNFIVQLILYTYKKYFRLWPI